MPDRDLVPGVEVDTDLGASQVYETPGHAPSHVVLHQPERGLLLSGDHLLGRVSLFFDYGWSPDPAGEFLHSLDIVDELDVQLVLAGHGRPVRDARALVEANRAEVTDSSTWCARRSPTAPRTPFEIVPDLVGEETSGPMAVSWGLAQVLSYLDHLELLGEAEQVAATPSVPLRQVRNRLGMPYLRRTTRLSRIGLVLDPRPTPNPPAEADAASGGRFAFRTVPRRAPARGPRVAPRSAARIARVAGERFSV